MSIKRFCDKCCKETVYSAVLRVSLERSVYSTNPSPARAPSFSLPDSEYHWELCDSCFCSAVEGIQKTMKGGETE
jgi:hypothetical protein